MPFLSIFISLFIVVIVLSIVFGLFVLLLRLPFIPDTIKPTLMIAVQILCLLVLLCWVLGVAGVFPGEHWILFRR